MNTKMKGKRSWLGRFNSKILSFVAVLVVCIFTTSTAAFGALEGGAGNTVIRNTVTVNYQDGGGTAQTPISAAIDVIVNTIDVTPTVVSFSPLTGSTDGTGSTETYDVTIRTNSNGPGVIALGATDVSGSEINIVLDLANPASLASGGSIFLGATVIDPADTNGSANMNDGDSITFLVPNDGGLPSDTGVAGGGFSDGIINGLTDGDIVYLHDGTTYFGPFTVAASGVVDPAIGSGGTASTGSIELTNTSGGLISITPAPGWMILEAKIDVLTVTQGVVTDPLAAASWDTTVTAAMNGNIGSGTVTTNATGGALEVSKYVRNVTTPNGLAGTEQTININGADYTFFSSGVRGAPTETLEYALVIQNTSMGATQAVSATDDVPAYTTLISGSTYGALTAGNIIAAVDDVNGAGYAEITALNSDLEDGSLAAGNVSGRTLTFFLGNGCLSNAGGDLPSSGALTVVYRVTID